MDYVGCLNGLLCLLPLLVLPAGVAAAAVAARVVTAAFAFLFLFWGSVFSAALSGRIRRRRRRQLNFIEIQRLSEKRARLIFKGNA